jgi:uncharacterized membrane protein HdeD (DUF308 family)
MIHEPSRSWGWIALRGAVAILFGILAVAWPASAFAALVILFGAYAFVDGVFALVALFRGAGREGRMWVLVIGVLELVAAIRLRKEITGEYWLGLAGVLSIAFGVLLFVAPIPGALAIAIWTGAYALVFGVMLLMLAFRLRKFSEGHTHAGTPAPVAR